MISGVRYLLALVLHKGNEYLGYMRAEFDLAETSDKVFFDFQGKQLLFYSCNSVVIPAKDSFCQHRVQLPTKFQHVGHNVVQIAFRNAYAVDGNGLHHFVDPEDKEEYVYSNFEPYAANKMFPCFDQPNLKAEYRLMTLTQPHWAVIGNTLETATLPASAAHAKLQDAHIPAAFLTPDLIASKFVWREFEPTPRISTYLMACIAGPYDVFASKSEPGIPAMRIFVRKSLKKFVTPYAEEFFHITSCGIKFYEGLFGQKFPFSKYDQIYCPEFNVGAMENAGAVTFTENYVFKDPPTFQTRIGFAETILHELSHMWFGDLVTMNWWNNLWLNESFATFISNLCMALAPGLETYRAAWVFFRKYKDWVYHEDQAPTTHPITAVVENTEDAENIFDGITYMKGASVLKQLYYLVSHETFCDGLKEYFAAHKWGNTELKDFIGALQNALHRAGSKLDLGAWVKQWLETKGMNEMRTAIEVKDGKIESFRILQGEADNADKVCRIHMLDIAFYDAEFKQTVLERVMVEDKPETLVEKVKGLPAPVAVLLNVNDYAYCKVSLDEKSIKEFQKGLNKVCDSLTRMIIWRSFWDMVRDGQTSSQEFLRLVVAQCLHEPDEAIFTGALSYASSAASWYVPREYSKEERSPIVEMLLKRFAVESSANEKKHIINYIISLACTLEHKKMLLHWLNEGTGAADAPLTQENRYSIIGKIYADVNFAMEEKKQLLDRELEKDKSDDGLRAKRECEAAIPTAENKAKHWLMFLDEKTKENEHMLFASMGGFNSRENRELLAPYVDKYFDAIINLFAKRSHTYAEGFFYALKPLDTSEEMIGRFEELLKKAPESEKTLRKIIREEISDSRRLLRAQKLYLACRSKKQA